MENKNKGSNFLGVGIVAGVVGLIAGIFGKQMYDDYVESQKKQEAKQVLVEGIFYSNLGEKKKIIEKSDGTEWYICPISFGMSFA